MDPYGENKPQGGGAADPYGDGEKPPAAPPAGYPAHGTGEDAPSPADYPVESGDRGLFGFSRHKQKPDSHGTHGAAGHGGQGAAGHGGQGAAGHGGQQQQHAGGIHGFFGGHGHDKPHGKYEEGKHHGLGKIFHKKDKKKKGWFK